MSKEILLAVDPSMTAALEKSLAPHAVRRNRVNRQRSVLFGRIKAGPVELEARDLIKIVDAAPDLVVRLWTAIETFGDRLSIYVDRERVAPLNKQALQALLRPGIEREPRTFASMFGKR